ncbi:MAG: 2OG-Fe(II) oxygenase [Erythrobacter sp.]|nr:2OG-Fe(II) oxygenase [Erythrobacter sp.]NCQ64466.1 2OG-Fe(II) oxygenase [Alphaproteobacteria bacterium]
MRQGWLMWREAIDKATIAKIEKAAAQVHRRGATTRRSQGKETDGRKSEIAWLCDQYWLRDLLFGYVMEANRIAFGVDVENIANIQYTEYSGDNKGRYNWHNDVIWTEERSFDRKISITVQLSDPADYSGGAFEFGDWPTPENSRGQGTVLVFPSYLTHRVAPLSNGTRRSLVAWFEGPRWR